MQWRHTVRTISEPIATRIYCKRVFSLHLGNNGECHVRCIWLVGRQNGELDQPETPHQILDPGSWVCGRGE